MINNTPLHEASQKGYLSIVEFLIKHGADINPINRNIEVL